MSSERGAPIRIVLVGKTGTGKSATGNTILGRDAFHEDLSFDAVTPVASQEIGEFEGRQITVVDTPGIFDLSEIHVEWIEMERCVELSVPGPHVFLLVVRLDVRFTPEERNAVEWIQNNFSQDAAQFTMVLFTHGDILRSRPVENLLNHNDEVGNLVDSCGGGYHVINNLERDDHSQVEELITKIDAMVNRNGGRHYTNEMYREAQRKRRRDWKNIIGGVMGAVAAVGGAIAGAVVGGGKTYAVVAGAATCGQLGAAAGERIVLFLNRPSASTDSHWGALRRRQMSGGGVRFVPQGEVALVHRTLKPRPSSAIVILVVATLVLLPVFMFTVIFT